jgi:hypothetical protein
MAKQEDMERVAKALKVNPQTVRRGLEQGCYPFGTAVKCERSYSYQFFPQKVKEFLGVDLDERKD